MSSLAHRRILVTRSRHQASELALRLRALGASPILIPTIDIAPPHSYDALDDAIAHLDRFGWLVFTSVNAVEAFKQRTAHHDSPSLYHIRTAVIGPSTAHAALQMGLNVVLVPPKAVAESLASSLLSVISYQSRILLVRAEAARDHLPNALSVAGADVTIADAYRTIIPQDSTVALQALFANPADYPEVITFTSSSTARNLFSLLEEAHLSLPRTIVRASIGPITTQALSEHGFEAHLEATEATIVSLVEAMSLYMENHVIPR